MTTFFLKLILLPLAMLIVSALAINNMEQWLPDIYSFVESEQIKSMTIILVLMLIFIILLWFHLTAAIKKSAVEKVVASLRFAKSELKDTKSQRNNLIKNIAKLEGNDEQNDKIYELQKGIDNLTKALDSEDDTGELSDQGKKIEALQVSVSKLAGKVESNHKDDKETLAALKKKVTAVLSVINPVSDDEEKPNLMEVLKDIHKSLQSSINLKAKEHSQNIRGLSLAAQPSTNARTEAASYAKSIILDIRENYQTYTFDHNDFADALDHVRYTFGSSSDESMIISYVLFQAIMNDNSDISTKGLEAIYDSLSQLRIEEEKTDDEE